jgi:hypothetical protein
MQYRLPPPNIFLHNLTLSPILFQTAQWKTIAVSQRQVKTGRVTFFGEVVTEM